MKDAIYVVNPKTQKPVRVEAVSFAEIKVKERADLERWVLNHSEILGEPLLIITSEFAKFDKSSKRLDLLALDENATLTIIELKLDAAGTLADQQAIRYAAFCSTMTIEQVVELLAAAQKCSTDEAQQRICAFLKADELPELANEPRVILAAGSIDDQELTSTVLWLRRFGVNISCVELTPYRLPAANEVIVVPRIIIPLPETREYQVGVERKEAARIGKQKEQYANAALWKAVGEEFNKLKTPFRAPVGGNKSGSYMQIHVGIHRVHYEFCLRKRERSLDAALHFEFPGRNENARWLEHVKQQPLTAPDGLALEAAMWGQKWAQVMFRVPYDGNQPDLDQIQQVARAMKSLIEQTWPVIQQARTDSNVVRDDRDPSPRSG
jgi:hypothetical protein